MGMEKYTVKILKFEGINGYARVYVDGKLTGEHRNGFLTWTIDITEACRGKKQITLQVDVEELTERIGTFYHGGISIALGCIFCRKLIFLCFICQFHLMKNIKMQC